MRNCSAFIQAATATRFAILSGVVLASACADGQTGGWTKLTDPSGFAVSAPGGWRAEGGKDGHAVIRSGDGQELALLQPFRFEPGTRASQALGQILDQQSALFPHAKIVKQEAVEGQMDEVIAKIAFTRNGAKEAANVLCFQSGGAGMLYAIAAPAASFPAHRDELIKILGTFRYGAPASADGLTYKPYTDPNEGAFSVLVPQGWTVSGGLTRVTPLDLRIEVDAASPDAGITAQYGSAKMLPFIPVAGAYAYGGRIRQGMVSSNSGGPFMFLNYETGAQFSKGYLNLILRKQYQDLQIGESKDRPDLQELVEKVFAKSPVQYQISTGETDFTFTQNGQPRQGVCIMTTILTSPGTISQGWKAIPGICTAPADKMSVALSVLGHLAIQKWSPAWAAKTNQSAGEYSEKMEASFEHAMIGSDKDIDNILTGTQDVQDASGHTFQVATGHNYYYKSAGGIVGTDSATPPNVGFTPLSTF